MSLQRNKVAPLSIAQIIFPILCVVLVMTIPGCESDRRVESLKVTATAFTSTRNETDSTPSIAAWGDTLRPGIKAIAVSRDLIKRGLTRGVNVSVEGLEGEYTVLDKMNKRWRERIDIYMGKDAKKAKEWGIRMVVIQWTIYSDTTSDDVD